MKIKAFINEKDVSTDWIDCVFDDFRIVQSCNQIVGFVGEMPVYCFWSPNDNIINWRAEDNECAAEIRKRLQSCESEEKEIYSECYTFGNSIIQKFYFKND